MENRQVPSPNAYDFYRAACEAMAEDELPESCSGGCACHSCDEEPRELALHEKSAIVERNSAALHKLREGFAYEYLAPEGLSSFPAESGPFYVRCRRLAKLLQMESEVLLAKGDPAGAMSSLLDAVRFGTDLPRGALIIDALVGHALQLIGFSRSWRIIDQLDAQSARTLARRAERICSRSWPFAETLVDEKRLWLTNLSKRRGCRWRFALAKQCAFPNWVGLLRTFVRILPLSRAAVLADFERCVDEHITLARMPYSAACEQPEPTGNYVSRNLLTFGAQSATQLTVASGITQKACLAAALALRAYRLDQGAYPGELSDLVPDYLDSIPQDPFAGDAPLRYRIDGDRYVLYSIGPDGVDDGGTAIFDPNLTFAPRAQYRVHANSKGDIVAGVNW